MRHIFVESRGNPKALNSSLHAGLLQDATFWYDGSDGAARALFRRHGLPYPWDPFNPRQHLLHNLVIDPCNWAY